MASTAPRRKFRKNRDGPVAQPAVAAPPIQAAVPEHVDLEQEYHTDNSSAAEEASMTQIRTAVAPEDDDDSDDSEDEATEPAPYLPEHLLKAPTTLDSSVPYTPHKRLEYYQRKKQRREERRELERLRTDAEANGVLAAGRAAQIKRSIALKIDRVRQGRISKKTKAKVEVSGRQAMLDERKRLRSSSQSVPQPSKKARRKRKAKSTATAS
ncbi:hypothetical protein LTR56_004084 [Elasticomyces elasticus]|nr:hypothetical protein LTR56_004084 [Elasticomyces elasticus]KAK3661353.1 hypothetical protein LTR22_007560 [Elasticomyces elasticus]KAK4928952.1 hypothetical protein LTR49_004453 [Elasticomyces elasticus]KAK5765382.1 hypothetical protein LTS12_004395 [Elasticomyces elasticus]